MSLQWLCRRPLQVPRTRTSWPSSLIIHVFTSTGLSESVWTRPHYLGRSKSRRSCGIDRSSGAMASNWGWCGCFSRTTTSVYTPEIPVARREFLKSTAPGSTRGITATQYDGRSRRDSDTFSSTTTIVYEAPDHGVRLPVDEDTAIVMSPLPGSGAGTPLPPPTLAPSSDFRTHEPGRPLSVVSEEGTLTTDRTERSSMISSSYPTAGLLAFSRRMTDAPFEPYTPSSVEDDDAGSRRGSGPLERVVHLPGSAGRMHGLSQVIVRSSASGSSGALSARRIAIDTSLPRVAPASLSDSANEDSTTPRVPGGGVAGLGASASTTATATVAARGPDSTTASAASSRSESFTGLAALNVGKPTSALALSVTASDASNSDATRNRGARRPLKRQGTGYVGGPRGGDLSSSTDRSSSSHRDKLHRDVTPRDRSRASSVASPLSSSSSATLAAGAGGRPPLSGTAPSSAEASPRAVESSLHGAAAAVWGRLTSSLRPGGATAASASGDGGRVERVSPLRLSSSAAAAVDAHSDKSVPSGGHSADDTAASDHVNPAFSHRIGP